MGTVVLMKYFRNIKNLIEENPFNFGNSDVYGKRDVYIELY